MAQHVMFSANQMTDIAIQTEKAGHVFYEAAAQHADNPQVRVLCEWLAGEEQTLELTHWLTDLTKDDVLKIIEQQQREQQWLAKQTEQPEPPPGPNESE